VLRRAKNREGRNLPGWVARTRPLAGPLSPRGPQPVVSNYSLTPFPSMGRTTHFLGYPGLSTPVLTKVCSILASCSLQYS